MGLHTNLVRVTNGDFLHPAYLPFDGTRWSGDLEFVRWLETEGKWEQEEPASWANEMPQLYTRPNDVDAAKAWVVDTFHENWNSQRWLDVLHLMGLDSDVWISPGW